MGTRRMNCESRRRTDLEGKKGVRYKAGEKINRQQKANPASLEASISVHSGNCRRGRPGAGGQRRSLRLGTGSVPSRGLVSIRVRPTWPWNRAREWGPITETHSESQHWRGRPWHSHAAGGTWDAELAGDVPLRHDDLLWRHDCDMTEIKTLAVVVGLVWTCCGGG